MWLGIFKNIRIAPLTLTLCGLFKATGNVEDHFPELTKILEKLEDNSPVLIEKDFLIQERLGNQMVADSAKGFSLSINLSSQSIHEDRPEQSFYHRYRSFGSIYAKKPIFHWGALDAKSKIASINTEIANLVHRDAILDIISQSRHSYLDLILLQKSNYLPNL